MGVITDYTDGTRDGSMSLSHQCLCPLCPHIKWPDVSFLEGREPCRAQRSMAIVSESDLEAQRAILFKRFFSLDSTFQVLACPCQGRWADGFRGMCGHHLWPESVPGFCSTSPRFIDCKNISVRSHIEHLLV